MIESAIEKLKNLPEKARKVIIDFTDQVEKSFNSNLYSVFLFGSASGPNYIDGKSDINITIILENIKIPELNILMELGKKYANKGLAIPLIFQKEHVVTSLDTFPIEFSDMKEHHIMLYGEDPFVSANIEKRNLRYQCERELKSLLVNLRRGFLRTGGKRENIEKLLEDSLSSVLAACRGMVWMSGQSPMHDVGDLLVEVNKIYNSDTTAIDRVWRLRKGQSGATAMLEGLFDDYISNVAMLAAIADKAE